MNSEYYIIFKFKTMKKILLLSILVFALSCSTESNQYEQAELNFETKLNKSQQTRDPIVCQEFTVGISWPFTIETTVYYCCPNEMCIPSPGPLSCPGCGVVGNDPRSNLNDQNSKVGSFSIHISDLIDSEESRLNINNIVISTSSNNTIDGKEVSIRTGKYIVNKNGYISIQFDYK